MTKTITRIKANPFDTNKKKRQLWHKDPLFINVKSQIQKNLSDLISSKEYHNYRQHGKGEDDDTKDVDKVFDDEKVVVLANKILNHISRSNKLLNSVLKKSKAFVTRKLIRKLKDIRENLNSKSTDEDKESAERLVKHLSDQIEIIKLIKKSELATSHFKQKISKNHILRLHPLIRKLYLEIPSLSSTNVTPEMVRQVSEEKGRFLKNELPKSITPEDGYRMLKDLEIQLVNQKQARSKFEECVYVLVKLTQEKYDGDTGEEKIFHGRSKPSSTYTLRDNEESDHLQIKNPISPTISKKQVNKSEKKEPKSRVKAHSSLFVTSLADISSSLETSDDDTLYDDSDIHDDWSDPDFDKYYGGGAGDKRKKNRMGQRARRLLWEKKYGEKANHLVASRKTAETQKSSALNKNRSRRRKDVINDNDVREFKSHHKHNVDNEYSLHPSWEAKKRQNEKMNNLKFQGKKIVFDDDVASDNLVGKREIGGESERQKQKE